MKSTSSSIDDHNIQHSQQQQSENSNNNNVHHWHRCKKNLSFQMKNNNNNLNNIMYHIYCLFGLIILANICFIVVVTPVAAEDENMEKISTLVPVFISKGGNIVERENAEIRLPCEIKDLGEHAFMWKFNTKFLYVGNLTIQQLNGVEKDSSSNGIIIKRLNNDLTGIYRCEISSNPPRMIQYNVSMHTAPVIIPNPANKDNKVVVSQDQPLVLHCNIATSSSLLPTTFQWKHNSKVIELNRTEFVIQTTQLSDAGDVICEARNEIGSRSHTFKVIVQAKPVITLSEQIVHGPVGTDVEIKCMAEAYPFANIEWYYNSNQPIHVSSKHKIVNNMNEHSSTLTIFNVGPKDHQDYFCLAVNSLGEEKAYFAVTGRPSKPKFTSPKVSHNGDTYQLEWVTFSQPPIKNTTLRVREIDHVNGQPGEWQIINVEPTVSDATAMKTREPRRRQTYMLENLAQDKSYEVDVAVANDFGTTKSDVFVFSTSDFTSADAKSLGMNFIMMIFMFLLISVIA
ncbi:protein amalgam-like isoform X2 [Dermatophagoides pteronyssinus]|uniref:protein amalgam-like isoform X2 n=1 Tax=Dermatophagoides pteronyssinus TaxID=6956 RepID=UPI003F662041